MSEVLPNPRYFIGALQSNKIKAIAKAQVVQSIDSLRHAEFLNQAADSNLEVFLQVNLSPAQGRRGFVPEDIKKLLKRAPSYRSSRCKGS